MSANEQILIVDNNSTRVKVLQPDLSNIGFDRFTAVTGAYTRRALQNRRADPVRLDIALSGGCRLWI